MEEIQINLECVASAMNDFIAKLQNFDTLTTGDGKNSAVRDILITVEHLRTLLKSAMMVKNNESQVNQIERDFEEFNWTVNCVIKANEYPKFILCCKSLVGSIMKMLGKRNCGVLVVEMYLKMCIKLINELSKNIEEQNNALKDLLLFQLLVKGFLSSTRVLKKFWYNIILPQQKCSVMLCLNQSFKTLCFLGKVIDKRLTHLIIYLLNRLKQCFNKLLELFFNGEDQCHNSEFINLMDNCLQKLDQLAYETTLHEDSNTNEVVSSLKPLIDELLCHAMTVSHISSRENDCGLIKSYSQKVLNEFTSMSEHKDESSISSNAESLSETLCQLEEIVNVAVLNVVLDVFIDINNPLRNLMNKCGTQPELSTDKSASDLEDEISIFDEHMDRIMHIGLFAVSCSTDVKKILEIRSCLASLESLEAELITSVISLYLHPNAETKTTFQYIFRNWLEEITELKNLMDLVLDPTAFCQVVEKRITPLIYELKNDSISVSGIKSSVTKILTYTKKLIKTLVKSMEHEDEEIKRKMKVFVENLQLAYQECEASLTLLNQDLTPKEISSRVTKRAVRIIRSINDLIRNMSDFSKDFDENITPEFDDPSNPNPKDVTPQLNWSFDAEVLTPYIYKGKLKTKERTILYNTPKITQKTPKIELAPWCEKVRSQSRSRCCKSLSHTTELENSLDLELTTLLDNITDLSNTFRATSHEDKNDATEEEDDSDGGKRPQPREEKDGTVFLGTLMRQKLDQSLGHLSQSTLLSIHKESHCEFETPERMHDLTMLERKINFLMDHIGD